MMEYRNHDASDPLRIPRAGIGVSLGFEVLWMVVSIAAIALLTGAFSVVLGQVGAMTPFAALLLLFVLSMFTRAVRRKRGMLAINYIEQAVRQNLPIPAMLGAAEKTESGPMRWRLGALREQIERGSPISTALSSAMPGIPPRALGLIASGERLGQLAPVLGRLARPRSREADDREPAQMIYLRWYPLTMLLVLAAAATLLMFFVMPKYKELFKDYGMPLPRVTVWVINVYVAIGVPGVILVALVAAIVCGRALANVIPMSGPRLSAWKWLTDRMAWATPLWRGITRNRGLADVCHLVADALEAGLPLDPSLLEAADACTNLVLHRRIVRWAHGVTSGLPPDEAARRAGMPNLIANLLRTAHGPDGARDVFRFLARYYESRHSAAAAMIQGAAIPLMVGIFGSFVATLALAMFLPLIRLINHFPMTGKVL